MCSFTHRTNSTTQH